ncbi:MAG: NAD(P)H-dependent oxidoreductase [Devosia sp.]|uniref:NADPH-dependent FMN reductase n=1 Tax=Devosia sp. TaxID=1871048 RepID=UPI00260922B4|nr:NAD(P)H-dependent oxidoreductase [Devosia sp.]MDB5541708.1 NAD(P)H-dependent oxidoreductase [Devosia sp.]
MSTPKIGIVISTTRQGRFGDRPAQWIFDIAKQRHDLQFELIDLRDYPIPMFDAPIAPAYAPIANEEAQRWAKKVAELDGFIFVTAEYNHSIPAVLKNTLDHVHHEWKHKPAAFVGYGGTGAARAVEHLRSILVELAMVPTRFAVHIGMEPYLGVLRDGKSFNDYDFLKLTAGMMLDELAWYARTLKAGREESAVDEAVAA